MSHTIQPLPASRMVAVLKQDSTRSQMDAVNLNPQSEDCYFYFYSTCTKGEGCKYRHCSAALGSEQVCEQWKNTTSCGHDVCAFRHSKMLRQRSVIPCYWESQADGCLKPHCPFLHSKPRPEPKNALLRLSDYKISAIKIKTVEELQKEREEKKVKEMEKNAATEEEVRGEKNEGLMDLRRELMKRILAEKMAFEERLKAQQQQKNELKKKNMFLDLSQTRRKRGKEEKTRTKKKVNSAQVELKKQYVRPTTDSVLSKQQGVSSSHSSALARDTLNCRNESKRYSTSSAADPKGAISSVTPSTKKTTPTMKTVAPTTKKTESISSDFKIKTLEQLKAERRIASSRQPPPENVPVGVGNEDEKDAMNSGRNQECVMGSEVTEIGRSNKVKKLLLVRKRRHEGFDLPSSSSGNNISNVTCVVENTSIPDSDAPLERIPESDTGLEHIPESDTDGEHITDSGVGSDVKDRSNVKAKPKIDAKLINTGSSIPIVSLIKRSHNEVEGRGGTSDVKRRKLSVNLHRQKKGNIMNKTVAVSDNFVASGNSKRSTSEISIIDLQNELFRDMDNVLGSDLQDKVLLEEMSQYDEEDDLLENEGGSGLSNSRNDDELLLQMEEFM